MRIVQLTLTDFLLVKDSGITNLTVDFSEDVQLIVGSNGSGKSSTLRQLSTFPSPRSLFGKKGFKSLTVEHKGAYYRIESEYEKPSSPHAIYGGDTEDNLNPGRTTDVQKEVLETYLGITPFVDNLIMNAYSFPKMSLATRKEFLMAHSPDNIGFVFQYHKQIVSKIKACKNNLARLQSRKILAEQEFLSEENLEALRQEKDKISQDLGVFQQNIMDLEVGTKVIGQIHSPVQQYNVHDIKRALQRARYEMVTLTDVSRDDVERRTAREKLIGTIAACEQKLEEVDRAILAQSEELNELEARYKELAPDADLQELENSISRLERDRDRLSVPKPEFELSREELDKRYQEWETVRDQLSIFEGCPVPLYPAKKRQRREKALSMAQYRLSTYDMKINDLKHQYEELSKRHTVTPRDLPQENCAKDACPLYTHFMEGYQHAEASRRKIQNQIRRLEHRAVRHSKFVNAAVQFFTSTQLYTDRIAWLVGYAQSNPVLYAILRQIDILSTLKTNPNRIVQRLKDAYDHIDRWLKLKIVLSDLETVHALKKRLMGAQDHDTVKLVVSMENLSASLHKLRTSVQTIMDKWDTYQSRLNRIERYEAIKEEVFRIREIHILYTRYLADRHELDTLSLLNKGVLELRARGFQRLGEIEQVLRKQGTLRYAYEEEILAEIARIEKDQEEQEQIEKALLFIPKKSTVGFLNAIFKRANLFISQVWTVPFEIELLTLDDPLTYEFSVSGDNDTSREMKDCSEGQTEILTLAINLALRIELGHLDYPICLDESGRTFDETHKHNLVTLLKRLLDDRIISQLFLVSHTALIHEAFPHAETLVLRQKNMLLPEVYNRHCTIQ